MRKKGWGEESRVEKPGGEGEREEEKKRREEPMEGPIMSTAGKRRRGRVKCKDGGKEKEKKEVGREKKNHTGEGR